MDLARYCDRRGGHLGHLHGRMNDLFGRFFEDWPLAAGAPVGLAIDVAETDDAYTVRAELPGVKIDDVEITIENNTLSVAGEKSDRHEESDEAYRLTERRYGRFHRALRLPRRVDADAVEAEYTDGVLTITLPKCETAKARRIEVGK